MAEWPKGQEWQRKRMSLLLRQLVDTGMTQQEVADKLEVTQKSLYMKRTGRAPVFEIDILALEALKSRIRGEGS